jgi:hypothetical protein
MQIPTIETPFRAKGGVVVTLEREFGCEGRGSQHFLRDHRDRLPFFLYAPRADKVRRLQAEGHQEKEAASIVDTVDRERAAFVRQYFHVAEWPDLDLYHAMFNTASGDEAVIRAMLSLLGCGSAPATAESVPA